MFLSAPPALPISHRAQALAHAASARPSSSRRRRTRKSVLDIVSVEDNKQILSLSGGGKVSEFLLIKRVLVRVHDNDGNDWLPTSEVLVRRSYTYSDTEALAKGSAGAAALARDADRRRAADRAPPAGREEADRVAFASASTFQTLRRCRSVLPSLPRIWPEAPGPLYVVHGDEPLLAIEAGDRDTRRRSRGRIRRSRNPGRRGRLQMGCAGRGQPQPRPVRRPQALIDLRIPSGKPGHRRRARARGLRQASERRYADADHPAATRSTLLQAPRGSRHSQEAGVTICRPSARRDELPRWIAARLARQKQRVRPTAAAVSGRYDRGKPARRAAGSQKLGLLPEGELDPTAVEQAVADVRASTYSSSRKRGLPAMPRASAGYSPRWKPPAKACRCCSWQLGGHPCARRRARRSGQRRTPVGCRGPVGARVWGKRQAAMERAGPARSACGDPAAADARWPGSTRWPRASAAATPGTNCASSR